MKTVGIVVTERCQASSVFTVVDLLMAANFAATEFLAGDATPFAWRLLGLQAQATAYNGCSVRPIDPVGECSRPDIVLVPGIFEAVLSVSHMKKLLLRLQSLDSPLQAWHAAGTVVGSVCTGNFLVAGAGLAAGRTLTCHWASARNARQLFPAETFVAEKMLIDHGDLVSAGGALAVTQLVLYLLQRFHSRELALATAKLMMVEPSFASQSRFAMFSPSKAHGDQMVEVLQRHIEQHIDSTINFSVYAQAGGITERQLNRRFKKATGETPLSYQQRMRIEHVKHALENSQKRLNTLVWETGYEDLTSFRRLFKRYTGMTMQDYRTRFSAMTLSAR